MGDRANIYLQYKEDKPGIYFYTHYKGSQLPTILQRALRFAEETVGLSDDFYTSRIIFDQLTEGSSESHGYGIAPYMGDNEYPILIVDFDNEEVYLGREPKECWDPPTFLRDRAVWPFDHYIELTEKDLDWQILKDYSAWNKKDA